MAEPGRLTQQMVLDAIEKVKTAKITLCVGSDQHVVHPKEWERGGLVRCAACFGVIDLGPRCQCRDSNNEGPIKPPGKDALDPSGLHYAYCPLY